VYLICDITYFPQFDKLKYLNYVNNNVINLEYLLLISFCVHNSGGYVYTFDVYVCMYVCMYVGRYFTNKKKPYTVILTSAKVASDKM
jgi:hypothetical protein